ncbi:glycerol-3-phosphate acyltransferase 1-like [Chenopodium quinoa]|uniref:glycerol-3-phosphate acyltransferase 1-like n=1 Tax=Chenopodium quinoa TaxID=63459 RepID=UPI000B78BF80|nr:glycerol-3-phosphate acyltransferase 1-like [Chenopodium quinoa]
MLFPAVVSRVVEWLVYQLFGNSCFPVARKIRNYSFHLLKNPSFKSTIHQHQQQPSLASYQSLSKHLNKIMDRHFNTMVCDFNGTLLRSQSFFPFFMLVAFEGGSLIRSFLLLLSYPFTYFLDYDFQLRVMIFITFCGLKVKNMACVERTVLPKFYLEEVNYHVYQALTRTNYKVIFTRVPRVMVEGFLKDYLKVDQVFGTELNVIGNYYSGLLSDEGLLVKYRSIKECFSDERPDFCIGNSTFLDHFFMQFCKEAYVVDLQEDDKICKNEEVTSSKILPRDKYPKPLIFHDGRLAFLPTPSATFCMFMWLPLGILLAIFRVVVGVYLPFKLSNLLGQLSGIRLRIKGTSLNLNPSDGHKGVLYVCTHRTLLDPVILSVCLKKPLTAVTYSLSKTSEIIAPIKTVRLTRDRKIDGETMERLLSEGDLVVCPEGTTCREPYLLRFSSLFAELADDIVPVALETKVTMFYGTTASGLKCLDPIFFLMNPSPIYYLDVLGKVPKEMTCAGGKSCFEVANNLQRQLANALDFECTSLTRKDKYLMLAGNEGNVGP